MLKDSYVPFFFLGVLIFSFLGFSLLKSLFDKIANISEQMSTTHITEFTEEDPLPGTDELHSIVQSFSAIEKQFNNTFSLLEKKTSEISILKDLSELCYVTFDPEEILHVTLERALLLTNSDLGSILTLEKTEPKSFMVKATVGLGKFVKSGDITEDEKKVIKQKIEEIFKIKEVKEWFNPEYQVFTEFPIMTKQGILKPDRVIITEKKVTIVDFKTGEENEKHIKQIKQYERSIKEMGYKKIDSILFYLKNNHIKKIE